MYRKLSMTFQSGKKASSFGLLIHRNCSTPSKIWMPQSENSWWSSINQCPDYDFNSLTAPRCAENYAFGREMEHQAHSWCDNCCHFTPRCRKGHFYNLMLIWWAKKRRKYNSLDFQLRSMQRYAYVPAWGWQKSLTVTCRISMLSWVVWFCYSHCHISQHRNLQCRHTGCSKKEKTRF